MADLARTTEIQDEIVRKVAAGARLRKWERILVNIEMALIDGDLDKNCLLVDFARDGDSWCEDSRTLPLDCYGLFGALWREYSSFQEPWDSCTVEIDRDGKSQHEP